MRTEQLIRVIAADDLPPQPITPRLLGWGGVTLLLCGAVALTVLGLRPQLGQALTHPVTAMKWLLPLLVGAASLAGALALTRPQTRRVPSVRVAASVGVVAGLWLAVALLGTPVDRIWPEMRGQTSLVCLLTVTGMSLPTLAVVLAILREGASPAPARSGALAGLAVGGFATFIYAFRCDQDQPLFFLTWYSLAMLISMAVGALAGRRLLRW